MSRFENIIIISCTHATQTRVLWLCFAWLRDDATTTAIITRSTYIIFYIRVVGLIRVYTVTRRTDFTAGKNDLRKILREKIARTRYFTICLRDDVKLRRSCSFLTAAAPHVHTNNTICLLTDKGARNTSRWHFSRNEANNDKSRWRVK